MIWLSAYALMWLLLCGYSTLQFVNRDEYLTKINELVDSSEIYDAMLSVISPQQLVAILAIGHLLLIGIDILGLALSSALIPLPGIIYWIFYAFLGVYTANLLYDLKRFYRMSKAIIKESRPFVVIARYLRKNAARSDLLSCFTAYGKCLLAANLFIRTTF